MQSSKFFDDEFKAAVRLAGAQARIETLQAGVPVFYRDAGRNLDLVEYPNGRKFEIRFLDGASGDRNYKVTRTGRTSGLRLAGSYDLWRAKRLGQE